MQFSHGLPISVRTGKKTLSAAPVCARAGEKLRTGSDYGALHILAKYRVWCRIMCVFDRTAGHPSEFEGFRMEKSLAVAAVRKTVAASKRRIGDASDVPWENSSGQGLDELPPRADPHWGCSRSRTADTRSRHLSENTVRPLLCGSSSSRVARGRPRRRVAAHSKDPWFLTRTLARTEPRRQEFFEQSWISGSPNSRPKLPFRQAPPRRCDRRNLIGSSSWHPSP